MRYLGLILSLFTSLLASAQVYKLPASRVQTDALNQFVTQAEKDLWNSGTGNGSGSGSTGTIDWSLVLNKPSVFAPSAHNHDGSYYTKSQSDAKYLGSSYMPSWGTILNVPSQFPPSAHTHVIGDILNLASLLDGKVGTTDVRLSNARTPLAHQHAAGDITSGVFSPFRLGSGTPDASKVLYGDGNWKTAPSGGSGGISSISTDETLSGSGTSGSPLVVNRARETERVAAYLRGLPGFGANKVLGSNQLADLVWIDPPVSTTGGGGTNPGTPSPATYPDSTQSRVNTAVMNDVFISNYTQLASVFHTDQTNKRFVVADGLYVGYLDKTANWTNVLFYNANRAAVFSNEGGLGTTMFLVSNTTSKQIKFQGIKFQMTGSHGDYAVVQSNELNGFDGLEFAFCEFTAPNSDNNLFGIAQYSTGQGGSNSGNIAKNLYIHDCYFHDGGRMGAEILCQRYDQSGLYNITLTNNRFERLGLVDASSGMGFSFSGLIKYLYLKGNKAKETNRVAFELVNVQYAFAYDNDVLGTTSGVGWGISDDGQNSTLDIEINGGTIDADERPFYVYGAKTVHIDAQNKRWFGHSGVQMRAINCTFVNMNVLIHARGYEAGWEFLAGSSGNTLNSSTVSSAGALAAGYNPSYESIILRPADDQGHAAASGNTLANVTTILGKNSAGGYYTDGKIVDQGTGNTITNNTAILEP